MIPVNQIEKIHPIWFLLNLFYRLFLIFAVVVLLSESAIGVQLSAVYKGGCNREIGIILSVDDAKINLLNLQGDTKTIRRFEIIYIAQYPLGKFSLPRIKPSENLKIIEIKTLYEARDFNKAMREIMSLADKANQYVDKMQPWVLSKTNPKDEVVQQICTTSLNLFRILAIMLTPVLPELTNKISTFLNEDKFTWDSIDKNLLGHNIRQFKPLLGRIEDKSITQLIKSTE